MPGNGMPATPDDWQTASRDHLSPEELAYWDDHCRAQGCTCDPILYTPRDTWAAPGNQRVGHRGKCTMARLAMAWLN
jgi:hypothetical protein